ncbi:hypothetical protein CLOM_g22298 [Closterium sp. NIES-68]|nr:hypothetical protein CLOM_g22298 [Closterium sp. NIES-68]GJP64428.1 hypothetical protein CLOP_g21421 [Closterium sp. NIES-67]
MFRFAVPGVTLTLGIVAASSCQRASASTTSAVSASASAPRGAVAAESKPAGTGGKGGSAEESEQRRVIVAVDHSRDSLHAVDWAIENHLRPSDLVTMLHVQSPTEALTAPGIYAVRDAETGGAGSSSSSSSSTASVEPAAASSADDPDAFAATSDPAAADAAAATVDEMLHQPCLTPFHSLFPLLPPLPDSLLHLNPHNTLNHGNNQHNDNLPDLDPPALGDTTMSEAAMDQLLVRTEERQIAVNAELKRLLLLRCSNAELQCEVRVVRDADPRERIVAEVADRDADVLILGSRGMGPVKRMLIGSVSDYCVNHAPCPVVVVKPSSFPS